MNQIEQIVSTLGEVLIHTKKLTHVKKTFDPRNPRKSYDTRKMCAYVEKLSNHVIQATPSQKSAEFFEILRL